MADGLPASVDTERFVLGSILLDDLAFAGAAATLKPDDFSIDDHRRIFRRMCDLYGREERIDRITVYEELAKHSEATLVGGLEYLVRLDDGLPLVSNLDSYIRVLQEKTAQRKILWACQNLSNHVTLGDPSTEILAAAQELFSGIAARGGQALRITDLPAVRACGATEIQYFQRPLLAVGTVVALTGDSGCGKTSLANALARDVSVPVLFLDRENSLSVTTERLNRIGFADSPRLRYWGGWCDQEAPLPDAPAVTDWVKTCEAGALVVVDSLSSFHQGDQNDATEMRAFMHRCRRLADLGATVIVLHHTGKGESSSDYRGSSDFKAAIDCGYHVSNFGDAGRLGTLVLRPFKLRFGAAAEITYSYAGGQFIRGDAAETRQSVSEQLTALLRLNPGIAARKFDDLVNDRGLGRNRSRTFLGDGLTSGLVRFESGPRNAKRYFLAGMEAQCDL